MNIPGEESLLKLFYNAELWIDPESDRGLRTVEWEPRLYIVICSVVDLNI
jgi:hypothetical protein